MLECFWIGGEGSSIGELATNIENKTRPRSIQVKASNIRNMTKPKDQNKTKTKTKNRQSTSRAADQVINVTTYEFGTKLN